MYIGNLRWQLTIIHNSLRIYIIIIIVDLFCSFFIVYYYIIILSDNKIRIQKTELGARRERLEFEPSASESFGPQGTNKKKRT